MDKDTRENLRYINMLAADEGERTRGASRIEGQYSLETYFSHAAMAQGKPLPGKEALIRLAGAVQTLVSAATEMPSSERTARMDHAYKILAAEA